MQRRARRLSISSESGSSGAESGGEGTKGRAAPHASRTGANESQNGMSISPPPPGSSSHLKRKSQSIHPPPSKRKKSEPSGSAEDDPARKYCLGKYQEMMTAIFLKYPHDASGQEIEDKVDISAEEKTRLQEEAKKFAADLEQCVYEIYAERDKDGNLTASGKYKWVARTVTASQPLIT